MQAVAEFHKVSFDQFLQDSKACGFTCDDTPVEIVKAIWSRIKLPKRATSGSAGYDFYLPYPFCLQAGKSVTIPTGIRVDIQPGWCLVLIPRSGLGFKYGFRFANTLGLIDSDYFFADNEGHMHAKIYTDSNMSLQEGDRYMQGVFLPFGVTRSDSTDGVRTGGFGSTGVSL